MKRAFNYTWFCVGLSALALASSCKPEIDAVELSAGTADFTKYIAVGNSLTAGFADGGLYLAGQQVAYPNLIAQQMQQVGGGEFRSPFFSEDQRNGSGYLRLASLVDNNPELVSVTTELAYRSATQLTKYTDEIENLGVPGMRLDLSSYGPFSAANLYFERLLPDEEVGTRTYLDFATSKDHTFFSFWLGNNDVLGYAMNGAYQDPLDPLTTLTSVQAFSALYTQFVASLTANGQRGVLATIPTVTSIPYFRTVTTDLLVAGIVASTGGTYSAIYIQTADGVRTATSADLFTLEFPTDTLGTTSGGIPGYGLIPQNPLSDELVLDQAEVLEISERVNAFNEIIRNTASSNSLALADAQAYLDRVSNPGINYNGIAINAAFITGNAFSLDGIHLTPIGNALIANLFIDAINAQYGSSIPKVDGTQYGGVVYP